MAFFPRLIQKLQDLFDYDKTSAPTDGQALIYDANISKWKPGNGSGSSFDQSLNTSDDVTFNSVSGDGSGLTNLPNGQTAITSPLKDTLQNPSVDFENRKLVSNTHNNNPYPDSFTYDQQAPYGPYQFPDSFVVDFPTPDTYFPYPHDFYDDTTNTGEYFQAFTIQDWKDGIYQGDQGSTVNWNDVSATAYTVNYPAYTEYFSCLWDTGACTGDQVHTGVWADYSALAYSVSYGAVAENFTCDQNGDCTGDYGASGPWSNYQNGSPYNVVFSPSANYISPLDWSTGVLLDKDGEIIGGITAGRIDTDNSGILGLYDNDILIAKLDANINGNARALVVTADASVSRYASIGVNDANDPTKGCFLGIDYNNGNCSITTGYTAWPMLIAGSINCFVPRDGLNLFNTTVPDNSGAIVQVDGDINITGSYKVNSTALITLPAIPDAINSYRLDCIAGVLTWTDITPN